MRGFEMDGQGDVLFREGDIAYLQGDRLLDQTAAKVMETNKGEWFLNQNEGMDFEVVLCKKFDPVRVKKEMADALSQVDSTFVMELFETEVAERKLAVRFAARGQSGRVAASVAY